MLDRQLDLEEMYSKQNISNIILSQIDTEDNTLYEKTVDTIMWECNDIMDEIEKSAQDIADVLWIELLRDTKDKHIQSIGTVIGCSLGLTTVKAIEVGTRILEATAVLDLFKLTIFENSKIISPLICLDTSTATRLSRLIYQPPMVCKPNPWKDNNDGGWLSVQKHAVLGKGNQHNAYLRLDVLNILQSVPWIIDQNILFQYADKQECKADNELFMKYLDQKFYFVWRFCKRGRMHNEGYNISLQSSEYRKAIISMADKEKVSKEGEYWLKIAIANAFGEDKKTFKERIKWFNQKKVFDLSKADTPIMGDKLLKAYADMLEDKEINTNIFLDATASGIQIMAALSGCEITAKAVNMIGVTREDIYSYMMEEMNKNLAEEDHVTREQCKYPLMTHYYNSKERPRQDFNDNQLVAFYDMLSGAFPGAEDVMESINESWVDKEVFEWRLPDGHKAIVRSKVTEGVNIPIADTEFYYRYTTYKACGNNRHLAPNIIHSIDGYIAREMVRRCKFPLAHIHDSFTCHPNNMGTVRDVYKTLLKEIADSSLLQDILREITGKPNLMYTKLGYGLSKNILSSEHTLS